MSDTPIFDNLVSTWGHTYAELRLSPEFDAKVLDDGTIAIDNLSGQADKLIEHMVVDHFDQRTIDDYRWEDDGGR